jgi:ABC-type Co2+ transport system permease subunit
MLGHGAVTAIGVNVLAMALPGPILARLARPALASRRRPWVFWSGFGVGAGSVLLATGIVSAAYLASDWQYARYVPIFVAVHASLAAVEGVITGSTAVYLSRVRPSLLDAGLARVSSEVAHVS